MSTVSKDEWTVRKLLEWTAKFFSDKDLDEPRLSAQLLLAKVMACSKVDLYVRYENAVPEAQRSTYRELVRRAANGEPIAYLIDTKEFYSLQFSVGPAVLIPRPETELLVQWVIRKVRSDSELGKIETLSVLELGTGCACIAVSLAKYLSRPHRIVAADRCERALEIARRNVERHNVTDRVELVHSDLFASIAPGRRFDLVVGNLPYVTEDDYQALPRHIRDYEPKEALLAGPDGLRVIEPAAAEARHHLRVGGYLVFEIGYGQSGKVRSLLERHGYDQIEFEKDDAGIDRVAIGRNMED